MSVTATQLSRSGARGRDLDAVVREQIQIIDDRLLRAERVWGRNVVSHDLPTLFSIPGLSKKDAQRIVYTSIIRSLDKRGFEVGLHLKDENSVLYTAWMTDLDASEVEAMNALITEKRLDDDGVQRFLTQGIAPAPRSATAARQGRSEQPPTLRVKSEKEMRPRGGMAPAASDRIRSEPVPATKAEQQLLGQK